MYNDHTRVCAVGPEVEENYQLEESGATHTPYCCTVADLIAGLASLPSDMLVLTYQDFGHYDYAFGRTTKADLEGMLNSRQFHIMLCVDSPEIRRAI